MKQKQCTCCHTRFTPLRNPDQRYCSKPGCQKKRVNAYKKQKLKKDEDYKQNQRAAQHRWYKKHPEYWKQYRYRNPGYVAINREKQRLRNKKSRPPRASKKALETIAKVTPLISETPVSSLCYQLILLSLEVIVKRERYRQEEPLLLGSTHEHYQQTQSGY